MFDGAKNVPRLIVVEHAGDLPFKAPKDAKGAIWHGGLYLVHSNVNGATDARNTIAHEVIGPFGLRGFFGSELDAALDAIHSHNPLIQKYAAAWVADNQDVIKQQRLNAKQIRYRSIEEAMAKLAEARTPFKYAHQHYRTLQKLLRKIELFKKAADWIEAKSNAEALEMLRDAGLYISHGL